MKICFTVNAGTLKELKPMIEDFLEKAGCDKNLPYTLTATCNSLDFNGLPNRWEGKVELEMDQDG